MKRNVQICCDIEVLAWADKFILPKPNISRSSFIEQLLRERKSIEETYVPSLKTCEVCAYEYSADLNECPNCALMSAQKTQEDIKVIQANTKSQQEQQEREEREKADADKLSNLEKANQQFRDRFAGNEEAVKEFLGSEYSKIIFEDGSIHSPELQAWRKYFANKNIRIGYSALRRLVNNADYFTTK